MGIFSDGPKYKRRQKLNMVSVPPLCNATTMQNLPIWDPPQICQWNSRNYPVNSSESLDKANKRRKVITLNWGTSYRQQISSKTFGNTKLWTRVFNMHNVSFFLIFFLNKFFLSSNPILDTRISVCSCVRVFVCNAQGTPPGFWNGVDWRALVESRPPYIGKLRE